MKKVVWVLFAALLLFPAVAAENAFTCTAEKQISPNGASVVKVNVVATARGDKHATETTYVVENGGAVESTREVREVVKDGYVYTQAKNDPITALVGVDYSGTECDWVKTASDERVAFNQSDFVSDGFTCNLGSTDDLFETPGNDCTPEQFEQVVAPLIQEPDDAEDAALLESAKNESSASASTTLVSPDSKPSTPQADEGVPFYLLVVFFAIVVVVAFFAWTIRSPKAR